MMMTNVSNEMSFIQSKKQCSKDEIQNMEELGTRRVR